jgi:alkanesulfonate monooxygenase SsuD/methylene tetrahydromethanopterin reductase-like flavin-dependent oxidoreductase (luciferase family)
VAAFSKRSSSVGVVLPQGWRGDLEHLPHEERFDALVATAREAEALGFDSVWVYDHFQRGRNTTFEAWTSLAAVARETEHVRLGQLVTCALYRNPALLAKQAETLDAASRGRCAVGIGAGWDEAEYLAYGYPPPFPAVGERMRRLEGTARVLRERRPEQPLLIGGHGERVLLRLVARYADACNFTDSLDPSFYRGKLDVLRTHCAAIGRDDAEILKTCSFTVSFDDRTPREWEQILGEIAAAGIEYFILYFDRPAELETMRRFSDEVRL